MVTTPTKPGLEEAEAGARSPRLDSFVFKFIGEQREPRPAGGDALQALLAFSAMHQQVRQRRALAVQRLEFENGPSAEFESSEQFVLDEVLQLVAERAIAITGADGIGIALAENNEIVLRASAGVIKPGLGERIERDSAFSGACFREARIIRCDDTETDDRVNVETCRQLGARSMVAVPLCGRRRVIGVLEAFSVEPFGFNDSDVASLELLAELILAALKPEDEDRFADSAKIAESKLASLAPQTSLSSLHAPSQPSSVPQTPSSGLVSAHRPSNVSPETKIKIWGAPAIAPKLNDSIKESPAGLPPKGKTPSTEMAAEKPGTGSVVPPSASATIFISATEPPARTNRMIWVFVAIAAVALATITIWWKAENGQLAQSTNGNESEQAQSFRSGNPPEQSLPGASSSALTSPTQSASGSITPSATSTPDQNSSADTAENYSSRFDESPISEQPSKMTRVAGIRHWSSNDSSTVVLDLADQVQYEAHRLSHPDRIYFDLHDTSLAPGLAGKSIDIGDALLARARVAQPSAGLTRLVLETRDNSNYSVSLEPNPYRLVVRVQKVGVDPNAQVNLFPGSSQPKMSIVVPPPTKQDLQLRAHVPKLRIVVDAGHGGWDLGTVGRQGLLEKDLVLEIALRLGKLLESRLGADVILTRSDDNYIPLDERAAMANQAQADLFVSVHANYSDLPSARGVETYYTNFFTSPIAKDLETRSGNTNRKAASPAALTSLELHAKVEQSRRLAASVQRSLYGALASQNPGLRDRGVKEASYVVLTETAMPGVLAEVSFVSSPTDEQKLRSDGYREQIAEALYKGIGRYAANLHPVKLASAK